MDIKPATGKRLKKINSNIGQTLKIDSNLLKVNMENE